MFNVTATLVSDNMTRFILMLMFLTFSANVFAVENIVVQGLFSKKAVLMIDGTRHILSVGKTSPEGVKLISANKEGAILEFDGQQKEYKLGSLSTVNTSFEKRKSVFN